MRRILRTVLIGAVVVLTFSTIPVSAQDSVPAADAENGNLWFVELEGPPTSEGARLGDVRAQKANFRSAAAAAGVQYRELRSFDVLFNGFSVEVSPAHRAALASLPGVARLWPIEIIEAPEPPLPGGEPNLATAIAMTGADVVQNTLGLTGDGVRVAVMDTGIDYDHADFGGDGIARSNSTVFPTSRVVAGWDFVGDDFNANPGSPAFNPIPDPDRFPDDCGGHGTHVAGIVGANGTAVGVAPKVEFGAYRVFGCGGSTTADIMLAAMERALEDGMHVLNMSIGSRAQWPQYPTGAAASRLVDLGMVVVASIGNNGPGGSQPDGPYAAGAPGVGHEVIGVASYDNSHTLLPYFTVGDEKIGYVPMTFAGPTPTSGSEEIVDIGRACSIDLPLAADPTGKVALASRGNCSFAEKAANAIDAGAVAVVVSNNAPGVFNGTLGEPIDGTTPVVGISLAGGNFIRAQTPPVSMTWTDLLDSFPSPTGGLISGFSSFGMAADLTLKPDIGAPGGNINSTIPLEFGGHGLNSGTSMSSPHVAGAVALLLEAEPNTEASAVRARLQNSAKPTFWSGNPGLNFLEQAHRQGAGLLDIQDAIATSVDVTPGKLSLGESEAGPQTRRLAIHNRGNSEVMLELSHVNALSSGPKNPLSFQAVSTFLGNAQVAFSAGSLTVQPGQTEFVDVTITAAAGPDRAQYGGFIVLAGDDGHTYRVPFAGFVGDYQTVEVLTPSANFADPAAGFPWLAKLEDGTYFNQPEGAQYSMEGDDIPFFLVHLDHQSRRYEFRVIDAASGNPVHPVFANFDEDEYIGRNTTATGFFAFAWDGTRSHDNGKGTPDHRKMVPNGVYAVELRVLKALGDAANPDHWETWTSPPVTLARTEAVVGNAEGKGL